MSLQQDIIKLNNKKIFINPFLYLKKFDAKTKRWLREPGQISKSRIDLNRIKLYPELDWETLTVNEKLIKNRTIELFLKTMIIIKTFHPNLNSENLLEVEKQLIRHQKIFFEKWFRKNLVKKERVLLKEKRRSERFDSLTNWQKWLSLKETQKLIIPAFVIILLSVLIGWFAGISKNSCNPYFESINSTQL